MKKAQSNFKYQGMYMQNYIPSNTKKPKYHRIHHTPAHNPYTKKNNHMLLEKSPAEELDENNKKNSIKLLENSCIMLKPQTPQF